MPGRTTPIQTAPDLMSNGTKPYRYGFNGKETDFEVKDVQGSQQDYGMRIYDPRLGRFLSVDPITSSYPELTPYQFASNRPIDGIDLDGLEFTDFRPIINNIETKIKVLKKAGVDAKAMENRVSVMKVCDVGMKVTGAAGLVAGAVVYALPVAIAGVNWAGANPEKVVNLGGIVAGAIDPNPNSDYPGGFDDLARLLKALPKTAFGSNSQKALAVGLGKAVGGFENFAKKYDLINFNNWGKAFKFSGDALLGFSGEFKQALNETVNRGGKIVFNLDGVNTNFAKKGYSTYVDATKVLNSDGTRGQITEWELSQLLRNENWFSNTIFYKDGKVVDAAKEGLNVIK